MNLDPALKHLLHGVLPSDPKIESPEVRHAWLLRQRQLMAHVLRCIAGMQAQSNLVLRGSAAMCEWFGQAARRPKDIDFVVMPPEWRIGDARTTTLFDEIVDAVTSKAIPGVELNKDQVGRELIWAYDRVPGERLVFCWTADDLPWGTIQIDFVFGEALLTPPERLDLSLDDGPAASLQVASKSLSLAWKLLWLHSDLHPQAKDLYDAMLLSEDGPAPLGLIRDVFHANGKVCPTPDQLAEFDPDDFKWIGFEAHDQSTVLSWITRLRSALAKCN